MARGSAPGERRGGRTKGTPNRNTVILRDVLAEAEANPAEALVEIARRAESEGNIALAADCWGKLAVFAYPKPRPVVLDAEQAIAFEAALASAVARAKLQAEAEVVEKHPGLVGLAERLERAHRWCSMSEAGVPGLPDAPIEYVARPPAPPLVRPREPAAAPAEPSATSPAPPPPPAPVVLPLPARSQPMETNYDPFADL